MAIADRPIKQVWKGDIFAITNLEWMQADGKCTPVRRYNLPFTSVSFELTQNMQRLWAGVGRSGWSSDNTYLNVANATMLQSQKQRRRFKRTCWYTIPSSSWLSDSCIILIPSLHWASVKVHDQTPLHIEPLALFPSDREMLKDTEILRPVKQQCAELLRKHARTQVNRGRGGNTDTNANPQGAKVICTKISLLNAFS